MKGNATKGISKPRLINRLLISFIIVSTVFGVLYYIGLSPKEVLYSVVPVTASKTQIPTFTFAFYGEGDNKIKKPMAVAVNNGLIYVSDAEASQVLVFNGEGKFQASIGKPGQNQGEFNFPYGLAFDNQNQLYIADMKNHRIQVFDTNGNFVKLFPSNNLTFGTPGGLAFKNNKIYITDIARNKVSVFNANGEKLLEFGQPGTEKGQFKYPNGITVDKQENIYVSDSGNNRVQVFDKTGKFIREFNGNDADNSIGFASPRGITALDNDMLIIVNSLSSQVWATDIRGHMYYRYGKKGEENNQFNFPVGISAYKDRLYITDSQNHGIKVYNF